MTQSIMMKQENKSCMNTGGREVKYKFNKREDATMKDIIEKYQQIIRNGETTKENL